MDQVFQQFLAQIKAVWHRRWYILIVAWLVSIAGWAWVFLMPDRYEASARVYVDTQSLLQPLLSGMTVQPDVGQQIKLMTRVLVSRPTLEKVARMTDMDLKATTPEQTDDMLNALANRIAISDGGRENLYTISYQNSNPELAKKVVQALLTIFVESSLGRTRQDIASSQKFIDQQLQDYQQKLDAADTALREFKQKHLGMMPSQSGDYISQLQAAQTQVQQAKLDVQEAVNRRNQLKQQLSSVEPTLSAGAAVAANPEIDARIQDLQSKLDQLRLQYTDQYPDVQAVKRLIAKLELQKKQEATQDAKSDSAAAKVQNPVYQQLTVAIAEADANVASLQARLAEYQRRYQQLWNAANTLPQVEQQLNELTRNYGVYKQQYLDLLQRKQQAEISSNVESKTNTVDFRVIDPPRVPLNPTWPNRPLLISLVPLVGLLVGFGVAFVMSQIRRTVTDRRTLRELTGLPVLGAVTKFESRESRRRKRRGLVTYGAGLAGLLGAYGVLLTLQLLITRAAT